MKSPDTILLCPAPASRRPAAEPAMDFSRGPLGSFQFGDYIGIDVGSDRVWTAYMGTAEADDPPNDPNHNPTVIWSSQILPP